MALGSYTNLNWDIYDADLVNRGLLKMGDTIYFTINNGLNSNGDFLAGGYGSQTKFFDLSYNGISLTEKFSMKVELDNTIVKLYINGNLVNTYTHPQKVVGEVRDYNNSSFLDHLNILGSHNNCNCYTGLRGGHYNMFSDVNFYNVKVLKDSG